MKRVQHGNLESLFLYISVTLFPLSSPRHESENNNLCESLERRLIHVEKSYSFRAEDTRNHDKKGENWVYHKL
jgi:hypothetical protein